MAYSGHRNLSTVQKYAHVVGSEDRMREDARKFFGECTPTAPQNALIVPESLPDETKKDR